MSEAQEDQIGTIRTINLGDGRFLFTITKTDTPLNGLHRVMDGIKTEYILAEFEEGLYHGPYKRYVDNYLIEEGIYNKGRKQGTFLEYFRLSRRVKESKEYKDGLPDGLWISYFTDGQIQRERHFKEGRQEGAEIKYDYDTGEVRARLNYHDGKKEGKQWQYVYSNVGNFIQENTYKDGVLEGENLETWWSGYIRKKGVYKKGKPEGEWLYFREDGTFSEEVNYKTGVKHGLLRRFNLKGVLFETEYYLEGRKHGEYRAYYEDGTIWKEGLYQYDEMVYMIEYNRQQLPLYIEGNHPEYR